jgi:hypothetical protein
MFLYGIVTASRRSSDSTIVLAHLGSTVLTGVRGRLELNGRMMDLETTTDHVLCLGQNTVIIGHGQQVLAHRANRSQLQVDGERGL